MPNPNPGTRYHIVGGAKVTVITTGINAAAMSFVVDDETGWPDGSNGPFWVVGDQGLGTEEKILCQSRTGDTVTVAVSGRGVDGTTATSHSANAGPWYPCVAAGLLDPMNEHLASTSAVHGVAGAVVGTTDAQTVSGKTINTSTLNSPAIAGTVTGAATYSGITQSGGTLTGAIAAGGATVSGNPTFSGAPVIADLTGMGHDHLDADDGGALPTGAPTASAVGDASATGSVINGYALRDHRHARETFGSVTAQTSFGLSASDGTGTQVAHHNHTHGTPPDPAPTIPAVFNTAVADAIFGIAPGDVVVTAPAITGDGSTKIRVTATWWSVSGTVGDVCEMQIKEGSTVLQRARVILDSSSNADDGGEVSVILTPSAGSHTYNFTAMRVSGAAGTQVEAQADAPATISVEQFRGAGSGVLANERPMSITIASNDAPADFKDGADRVATGTNDQGEVNGAIDDAAPLQSRNAGMPAGAKQLGKVQLSGGRFQCTSAGIKMRTGVHLQGQGWLTEIRSVACNDSGLIRLQAIDDHICHVSDLWLFGNSSGGGTCNALDFDMTGSTSTAGYPGTNADSWHHIHDLLISQFNSAAGRHGINLWSAATANNRGNIVDRIQIRDVTGDGVRFSSSSDNFLSNAHIGGCGGSGVRIATGNTKLSNVKAYYCDLYGFYATSGRGTMSAFESQDNDTGMYFDASPWSCSAVTIDTSNTAGLRVGTAGLAIEPFTIFVRSNGRYATQATGMNIDAAHADLQLTGVITPANITTKISGSAGSRSFVRVSDGSTLVSVG